MPKRNTSTGTFSAEIVDFIVDSDELKLLILLN